MGWGGVGWASIAPAITEMFAVCDLNERVILTSERLILHRCYDVSRCRLKITSLFVSESVTAVVNVNELVSVERTTGVKRLLRVS